MLGPAFFDRDPQTVAKELVGKILRRRLRSNWLSVQIVEVEAYFLREKGKSRIPRADAQPRSALHACGHDLHVLRARLGLAQRELSRGRQCGAPEGGASVHRRRLSARKLRADAQAESGRAGEAPARETLLGSDAHLPCSWASGGGLESARLRSPEFFRRGCGVSAKPADPGEAARDSEGAETSTCSIASSTSSFVRSATSNPLTRRGARKKASTLGSSRSPRRAWVARLGIRGKQSVRRSMPLERLSVRPQAWIEVEGFGARTHESRKARVIGDSAESCSRVGSLRSEPAARGIACARAQRVPISWRAGGAGEARQWAGSRFAGSSSTADSGNSTRHID